MHALKCKQEIRWKSVQKSHSVYLIKAVNKRGERSSQSYDKSNVSPYGSCYHSFCMRSSGVWKRGCVLPNWWRYGLRYVVVGYEWMIRTASRRMNHTLARDDAGGTKLNQINGSLFLFFFFVCVWWCVGVCVGGVCVCVWGGMCVCVCNK